MNIKDLTDKRLNNSLKQNEGLKKYPYSNFFYKEETNKNLRKTKRSKMNTKTLYRLFYLEREIRKLENRG